MSAFGQHRKFPPHARKTSGTQGRIIHNLIAWISSDCFELFSPLSNICRRIVAWYSVNCIGGMLVEFKHFDNLYSKQQNCPCLRNWIAKLNCEWRIIVESRQVFHLEPLCGFRSDFVYAKFLRPMSCCHLTFLLFSPSSVLILLAFLSCFLVFFFLR